MPDVRVVGQLGVHRPLHQCLGQLLQQPLFADQVFRTLYPVQQLVDEFLVDFHLFPSSIEETDAYTEIKTPSGIVAGILGRPIFGFIPDLRHMIRFLSGRTLAMILPYSVRPTTSARTRSSPTSLLVPSLAG
jgi:hypothetical protein